MNNNLIEYLEELSSTNYTPGGGSCACYIGLYAFSLIKKSIEITKNRKSYNNLSEEIRTKIEYFSLYCDMIFDLLEEQEEYDRVRFSIFMKKYKDVSVEEKNKLLLDCIQVSYRIFDLCVEKSNDFVDLRKYIAASILPDFDFGYKLINAIAHNCYDNIKANISFMTKGAELDTANEYLKEIEEFL